MKSRAKFVTMKFLALLPVAAVIGSTMWLSGCGHYICHAGFGDTTCSNSTTGSGGSKSQGGGGSSTGDAYLYVADAGNVQGMTLNALAGTIQDISGFTPPTQPNVTNYWTVVANQYLYVGFPGLGQIYGYTIGADGSLAELLNSPFTVSGWIGSTVGGTQEMIVNPAGTLMFIVVPSLGEVDVYQIASGGGLTEVGFEQMASGFEPNNLAIDGMGKYLYVSNVTGGCCTNEIAAFSIGSGGVLSPVPNSPFISNGLNLNFALVQMQGESSGKYMIGTTSSITASDKHLYVLAIQSDGELVPVTGSPFSTTFSPSFVTVQPKVGGSLVYSVTVSGQSVGGQIEGFQLNTANGTLSVISGSPFQVTGDFAQFDPAGKFLFVRDLYNKDLSAYDVSTTSTLSQPVASVGWGPGSWAPTDVP